MAPAKTRTVGAFMQISLDGYYCDPRGDMSFAHKSPSDAEWNAFVSGNAIGGGMLDSLQLVLIPVALGCGRSLFSGLTQRLDFALTNTRVFANGSVVLWYAPR
jgi:hypothetical protein